MQEIKSCSKNDKLYIVTNNALSSGLRIAQVAHVAALFVQMYPFAAAKWTALCNALVVLTVESAQKLVLLHQEAKLQELEVCSFREGDLCDELTALAFVPSQDTRKLLAKLPLACGYNSTELPLLDRERKLFVLSQQMNSCLHTPEQSVLQHGASVRDHYFQLIDHLRGTATLRNKAKWKLPSWFEENREHILTVLPCAYVMDRYLTLHDCGKPSVYEMDEKGKPHFPNHAHASHSVYHDLIQDEEVPNPLHEQIKYLILHDMDLHTINVKPDSEFFTSSFAMGQILAGLAEITANAKMFGGIESTTFKIKFKRIEKRGKMYFAQLNLKTTS